MPFAIIKIKRNNNRSDINSRISNTKANLPRRLMAVCQSGENNRNNKNKGAAITETKKSPIKLPGTSTSDATGLTTGNDNTMKCKILVSKVRNFSYKFKSFFLIIHFTAKVMYAVRNQKVWNF